MKDWPSPRQMRTVYALRYYLVTLVYLVLLYLAYVSVRGWFGAERRWQWMVEYLNGLSPERKLDVIDSLCHGHAYSVSRWGGALQLEVKGEPGEFTKPVDSVYLNPEVNEQGVLWRRYDQWLWNDLSQPSQTTVVEIPEEFYPAYGGYRNIRCWEKGCIPLADPGSARFAILDEKQRILPILINELPVGAGPTAVYRGWGGWCVGTVVEDTWQIFQVGVRGKLQLMNILRLPRFFTDEKSGNRYRFCYEYSEVHILSFSSHSMIIRCPIVPASTYHREMPLFKPTEIFSTEQNRSFEIGDQQLPDSWVMAGMKLSGGTISVEGTYVLKSGGWENIYISADRVTRMALVDENKLTTATLSEGKVVALDDDISCPSGMHSSGRMEVYPGDNGGTLVQARFEDSITLILQHYRRPRSTAVAEWISSDSISDQISLQNLPLKDNFGGLVVFPYRWMRDGPGPFYFGRGADTLRPVIDAAGLRLIRKFGRAEFTMARGEAYFRCHYGDYYTVMVRVNPANGQPVFVGPYMDINPDHLPFTTTRLHIEPFISGVLFVMAIVLYFALLVLVNNLLKDSQQHTAPDHLAVWPVLPGALKEKYELLHNNSQALRTRSDLMLMMGVLIGIFGLAFFWAVSAGGPAIASENWLERIRPLALLVFIETIAFFFLRQYRIIYNEYKRFAGQKLKLLNFIAALELYMGEGRLLPDANQLQSFITLLQNENFNLTSKVEEQLDTNALLDLLKQAMNK